MRKGHFTPVSPTQKRGVRYEDLACAHVQQAGLRLLERNYQSRFGELDLICLDRNTLVFIEVRYRSSSTHGLPVETVSLAKQRRIINTAKVYLQRKKLFGQMPCRFDVIGVDVAQGQPAFHWIRNAFQ